MMGRLKLRFFKLTTQALFLCELSGCSSPVNLTTSSASGVSSAESKEVDPFMPLPMADDPDSNHISTANPSRYAECSTCNNYLLVMLTAPGKSIQSYKAFSRSMLESGFKILAYQVGAQPDQAAALLERITTDLRALAKTETSWQDFITQDRDPAWGKIVVNGIGPSAITALKISQSKRLARLCSFHGPWALSPDSTPAAWLGEEFATPVRRMNFMIHKHEGGKDSIAKFETILRRMNIATELSSWTRLETNALYASLQGQSCQDARSCLIQDPIPTDESKRPIYQHAWRHLCVPPSMNAVK